MVDVIKDEKVMNRYGINKEDLEEGIDQGNIENASKQVYVNARVKDIVEGKVGICWNSSNDKLFWNG